jgi:uncharacterized DUF497 family protein
MLFEWDPLKDVANRAKHGVSFEEARCVFADPCRVYFEDTKHGTTEGRYFVIGHAAGGTLTVRFTLRGLAIRIFGAGYWRRGRRLYEKANRLYG